jgi:transcription antitermination protein NusB
MGKRRRARELALQALYAHEVSDNQVDAVLDDLSKEEMVDEEMLEFAKLLIRETVDRSEALDQEVIPLVKNWEFSRVALIDRLVLRLAVCEILHFQEIPPKVTINEAIDLAKKFSTEESGRFVNGILDALYKKLKQEGRVEKMGRGLVE